MSNHNNTNVFINNTQPTGDLSNPKTHKISIVSAIIGCAGIIIAAIIGAIASGNSFDKGYQEGKAFAYANTPTPIAGNTEEAYQQGYTAGDEAGYSAGLLEGEAQGYKRGYDEGQIAGYELGYTKGLEDDKNSTNQGLHETSTKSILGNEEGDTPTLANMNGFTDDSLFILNEAKWLQDLEILPVNRTSSQHIEASDETVIDNWENKYYRSFSVREWQYWVFLNRKYSKLEIAFSPTVEFMKKGNPVTLIINDLDTGKNLFKKVITIDTKPQISIVSVTEVNRLEIKVTDYWDSSNGHIVVSARII